METENNDSCDKNQTSSPKKCLHDPVLSPELVDSNESDGQFQQTRSSQFRSHFRPSQQRDTSYLRDKQHQRDDKVERYDHHLTPIDETAIKYYNPHILHVKSGVAYNWQLMGSLKEALKEAEIKLGRKIECSYKVNIIVGRNGKMYGLGYIWVTNEEVYNMLIGKNPDGTDRIEYIEDPNWVAPEKSLDEALDEIGHLCSGSWADYCEAEDKIIARYEPKILKKYLPPLIELPGYEYDEEQTEHIKNLSLEQRDSEPIPKKGYFHISPAFVQDIDEKYCQNVLCARNIPQWITEKDLKTSFAPYATNSKIQVTRKIKGVKTTDTYPFVCINEKNVAFITFDPNTRDAQFALLMMRKVSMSKLCGSETLSCLIVFNHSYNLYPSNID